MFVHLM